MTDTTLASTRTGLTSCQRREKNPVLKDGIAAVKKLMEIHADPEADADRKSLAAEYLAWQTDRLAAVHGER